MRSRWGREKGQFRGKVRKTSGEALGPERIWRKNRSAAAFSTGKEGSYTKKRSVEGGKILLVDIGAVTIGWATEKKS